MAQVETDISASASSERDRVEENVMRWSPARGLCITPDPGGQMIFPLKPL
jgi:hypothetical protein